MFFTSFQDKSNNRHINGKSSARALAGCFTVNTNSCFRETFSSDLYFDGARRFADVFFPYVLNELFFV